MDKSRLEFAYESIKHKGSKPGIYIGENVHIGTGTVIGESGFGFERDEHGVPVTIYHAGGVIIQSNVWVGANCVIARATMPGKYTFIGRDCKLDDICHVAHNCIIGPRTMMAGGVYLGGSVVIGSDCWIGTRTVIMNKVKIVGHTFIGVGSVVIKDIEEPGQVWAGNPARFLRMKREGE